MQLETPDLTPTLKQASDKWSPAYIGMEGRPVFQQAKQASARLSAGTVYFLAGASWIADLEAELLAPSRPVPTTIRSMRLRMGRLKCRRVRQSQQGA